MTARLTLCSFKTCPWVQRAAIMLRAKDIAYDIVYIDRDHRPDWFLAISPHAKVPVLKIGEREALFESNAIAEYLDETVAPRLHPADPIERARHRAWTDFVPTFASAISQTAYANTEAEFRSRAAAIDGPFGKLDAALAGREGPYYGGAKLSLVDAAYAPFLQRYVFMERLQPLGLLARHPRLSAWTDALLASAAVRASTVPNIEACWQENLILNKRWLAQFVPPSALGAQAA